MNKSLNRKFRSFLPQKLWFRLFLDHRLLENYKKMNFKISKLKTEFLGIKGFYEEVVSYKVSDVFEYYNLGLYHFWF